MRLLPVCGGLLAVCVLLSCAIGCAGGRRGRYAAASPASARRLVAADVARRTGADTAPRLAARNTGAPALPADVLTEQAAVNLALERNAAFRDQLAELDVSWADVVQAGVIANPDLQYLIPLGAKQAEATLTVPLEFLWLCGKRVESAR